MEFLPIFLRLSGQAVLVVGGGSVAARKIQSLLDADAIVTVIAPSLEASLVEKVDSKKIHHVAEHYADQALNHYHLIFAATDDAKVNHRISQDAEALNIPVNVVDNPTSSRFIMPSIVDRSPVIVAVSTGGRSPALARLIRARLEALIPASYGRLAQLLDKYRQLIHSKLSSQSEKRHFWERTLDGKVPELVFSGRDALADQLLQETLNSMDSPSQAPDLTEKGEVYLVGAGPGDPDLLTFRALRLIQRADVVLYDRLVSEQIVALVRADAKKIYVGKEKANHAVAQGDINRLLVEQAQQGHRVLRLKGGDPFIFGRGGEEIKDLVDEGIPFQVVPGVTAAAGCGAYAGIPLTHRDFSQSVTFVTGHLKDGSFNLNWALLSQPHHTVVIYMGLTGLEVISQKLIEHGVSKDLPAALIQQGTTANQRVVTATISTLHKKVQQENIKPPTLIIIGEVVSLQDKLKWFDPSSDLSPLINSALGHTV